MFKRQNRLSRSRLKGCRGQRKYFFQASWGRIVYWFGGSQVAQVAVLVSKKTLRRSVDRHLAKRKFSGLWQVKVIDQLPPGAYLVTLGSQALAADAAVLRADASRFIAQAKKTYLRCQTGGKLPRETKDECGTITQVESKGEYESFSAGKLVS